MNILLSIQTFKCQYVYKKVIEFSDKDDINKIFIVSSLMNELDELTIQKYSSIKKVEFIKSNNLYNFTNFNQSEFALNEKFINGGENMYNNILSSYRWLQMNDRNDNDKISFAMIHYYDIYNFWNNFFDNNLVQSIILLNDEHSSMDNILISSGKRKNVKNILKCSITGALAEKGEEYFSFYDSVEDEYVYLKPFKNGNFKKSSVNTNSDFSGFSNDYKTSRAKIIRALMHRIRDIIKSDESIKTKYMTLFIKFFNKVKTKLLLHKQLKYIKKLKKHYDSIAIDIVDHEKKYIYFCLHFDPEANTLPKDNMYFNQLLNIRIVASSLPKDWVLYVKEHPHQLSYSLYKDIFLNQLHSIDNFRSKYFYSYISSLENVELISMKSDHRKLVQGAEFIVSNTGTIFREASNINKRCLTFSKKSIYALLDNIDEVRDLVSCQKAINNKADVIVNENEVEKLFENYSITIEDLSKRDETLLNFIIESELYKIHSMD